MVENLSNGGKCLLALLLMLELWLLDVDVWVAGWEQGTSLPRLELEFMTCCG